MNSFDNQYISLLVHFSLFGGIMEDCRTQHSASAVDNCSGSDGTEMDGVQIR